MARLLVRLCRLRPLALLMAATALAVLGAVHVFQYGFGYAPCSLCLYQRWPWWLAAAGGAAAALLPGGRGSQAALLLFASGAGLLAGAGVGAYHAGVEWGWWTGPAACSGAGALPRDLDALRAALLNTPVVRCDAAPWTLFGLSMAGYNVLISLAAGGGVIAGAWRALIMAGRTGRPA